MRFIPTIAFGAMCALSSLSQAAPAPTVTISQCWIRLLPGELPSGGYFSVTNNTDQPLDLTAASTPAFGMAMLHQTRTDGGTARMTMVDRVTIPAKGSFSFVPGNYHLMLEQPTHKLTIGTSVPVQFSFSGGVMARADCAVKAAGATGP